MAAGGEGAPLAPAFHADAFGAPGKVRAIVNIGGIANVSLLDGTTLVAGFDSGPGNTLMDQWMRRHRGRDFDADGCWAAQGEIQPQLLARLKEHPYLALRGPRSTGREDFNLPWLDALLAQVTALQPADVQATLAAFTAQTVAAAITATPRVDEVYLCGGGAHNRHLVSQLQSCLPGVHLETTSGLGIDPDWVEGALFAWLAGRCLAGLAGNAPQVTGAAGDRVLGAVYPGRLRS
jgi:anhydro-N-acetylmuramic acid kinase